MQRPVFPRPLCHARPPWLSRVLCWLVCALWWATGAVHAEVRTGTGIDLASAPTQLSLIEHMRTLKQAAKAPASATEVLQRPGWEAVTDANRISAFKAGTIWFEGTVVNRSAEPVTRWLAVKPWRIADVQLQVLDPEGQTVLQQHEGGGHVPLHEREVDSLNSVFPLTLAPGASRRLLLRVQDELVPHVVLEAWEPQAYQAAQLQRFLWECSALAMVLTVGLLLLIPLDWRLMALAGWLISAIAFESFYTGELLLSLWPSLIPHAALLLTLFGGFAGIFLDLAGLTFLGLYRHRGWRWVYGVLIAAFAVPMLSTLWVDNLVPARLAVAALTLVLTVIWPISVLSLPVRGRPTLQVMLLMFSLCWLVRLWRTLVALGWMPHAHTDWAVRLNVVANLGLILAVALIYVRDKRRQTQALARQVADQQQGYQARLEQEVKERTLELQQALQGASEAKAATETTLQKLTHSQRMVDLLNRAAKIVAWEVDLHSHAVSFSGSVQGHRAGVATVHSDLQTLLNAIERPEDRLQIEQAFLRSHHTGEIVDQEIALKATEGPTPWRRIVGRVDTDPQQGPRAYGISVDITHSKHREQELADQRQRLASMSEATQAATWEWNIQTQEAWINATCATLLGLPSTAEGPLSVARWRERIHPDDLARTHERVRQHFAGESPYYTDSYRLVSRTGQTLWIESRGRLVSRTASGLPLLMMGALNNITDLVQARERAEKSNRAKSQFLSTMSHELRTPMNAILGFGQLLQSDEGLQERQRDAVQEITKAGTHLLELIDEVLDLSTIESGHLELVPEPIALDTWLPECLQWMQALATARGIGLHLEMPPGLVVQADRVRLKQVLLNLISNAIKYNRFQGSVTVTAQSGPQGRVRIAVSDTGPGIAPEHQASLFQPFHRGAAARGPVQGTGIGLTITRGLIEKMGGSIGFSSQVGVGSEFWLTLESTASQAPLARPGDAALPPPPAAPSRTVLCVDDNPTNLKLVEHMLAKRPHLRVVACSSAQQGLQQALSVRPDLILLDIHMPDMNGYEVLEKLRGMDRFQRTPIVALTASAMPADVQRGQAAGFTDYLTKPFDLRAFLQKVDDLLA
ncbi:MAG: ATP-binding protein [Burkholderiaceae bacterium]|nr:ATP-binding protein [Burkholderiaceae bacterium]